MDANLIWSLVSAVIVGVFSAGSTMRGMKDGFSNVDKAIQQVQKTADSAVVSSARAHERVNQHVEDFHSLRPDRKGLT